MHARFFTYSKKRNKQGGFSLLEVLVAMLIAAVAIGGVMLMHTQSLRQVTGNAGLNRAHLLLNNMAQRVQMNPAGLRAGDYNGTWSAKDATQAMCPQQGCSPNQRALGQDIPAWQTQVAQARLTDAKLNIFPKDSGWVLQIDWLAHDVKEAVVRNGCQNINTGRHCVSLWVMP